MNTVNFSVILVVLLACGSNVLSAPVGLEDSDKAIAPEEPGSEFQRKTPPPTPKFPRNTLHPRFGIFTEKATEEKYLVSFLPLPYITNQHNATKGSKQTKRDKKSVIFTYVY